MPCRLCGGPWADRFEIRGRRYAECPSCGFIGLLPADFPRREAERARYLLHKNDPADPGYLGFLRTFADLIPAPEPGALALDFGSGPEPALSALLAERGWRVLSFDPYFSPGEAWRKRRFGLIAVHEVAEHLRFPGKSLAALARRLTPGGLLAVRTRFAPERPEEFASWWYREDPTHVGFFRERSFAPLAARLGLELSLLDAPDLAFLRRPPVDELDRAE